MNLEWIESSVKTGNEKDAEHGSIPGYEFVRTVISEMNH